MPRTRAGHGAPNVLQGSIWAFILATVFRYSRPGFFDLAVELTPTVAERFATSQTAWRRAEDFCTNPSVTLQHVEGAELRPLLL